MKRKSKADLPTKTCAACGRPFAWRRKWAKVWEEVRFCSAGCRGHKVTASSRAHGDIERPRENAIGGRHRPSPAG